MTMSMEDIAAVTPEHEAACRKLIVENNIQLGGPYLPVSYNRLRIQFPGPQGGPNWGGMSFNPALGYLFVTFYTTTFYQASADALPTTVYFIYAGVILTGGVLAAVVIFGALAAVSGYYVFRHLETSTATEANTLKEFAVIRARYGDRQPLVEIVDPASGDIRINKSPNPQGVEATTLHVLTWNAEDERRLQTDVPLWLMRFNTFNVLSKLGIMPAKYRLVVHDIEAYGPGIVADFRRPGKNHVLIWAE